MGRPFFQESSAAFFAASSAAFLAASSSAFGSAAAAVDVVDPGLAAGVEASDGVWASAAGAESAAASSIVENVNVGLMVVSSVNR
jgi:hypothetical protein